MRAAILCALLLLSGAAAAETSDSSTAHVNAAKRAEIGFAPGEAIISPVVESQLGRVADVLNADIAQGPLAIEVEAYGPTAKARVLAVQRGANVRRALMQNGVPANFIHVRVMPQGGPADTVVISIERP